MSDSATTGAERAAQDLERLVHEMAAPPFHDLLGPQAVSVDPADRSVVVRLPFRPELCGTREQPFIHGGVIASLIDLTGHAAVAVQVGHAVPTIDLRIDYLRAAIGGDLIATGRALSVGSSVGRADVEVRSEDGRLVAVGRGVFSTIKR
jgi:uncharacterized protein (TIGR00369 family)